MTKPTSKDLRQAVEFADAVCALEGLHPTPEAAALNERVIRGEVSIDEAIAMAVEAAKARAASKRAPTPPT